MTEERHARVTQLFLQACELRTAERSAYLEDACGDDAELRAEVEEMLAGDAGDAGFDTAWSDRLAGAAAEALHDLSARSEPERPKRIGRYEIEGLLGEGGMGTVYRARQDEPSRVVALKVVRAGFSSPELDRRFRFEAQVLGRLQHPGIAQIHEAGKDAEGRAYFAMELVTGRPLLEHARHGDLNTAQRLELVARICDAVQHAHQKGVIHRDLKPGNILVVADGADPVGQPKILDFGVARAVASDVQLTTLRTDVGQLVGTISYMSPEQMAGDDAELDARSDVYALGVVLYEILTGHRPHDVAKLTIPSAARTIIEEEPTRLSSYQRHLRGDVETIVEKALEKERSRRYASASELAADLRRHLAHEPIAARPASALYQLRKFSRRNRAAAAGAAAVLLVLVAGAVVASLFALSEADARADAERAAARADAVRAFFLGILGAPAPGQLGADVTVVEALRRAEEELATAFPDQPEIRADVHAEMAVTFAKLGEGDDAERHVRAALAIRTAALGPAHVDTVRSMNDLAVVLTRPGDLDEAEELLRTGLELFDAPLPEEAMLWIHLHQNLANVAFNSKRYDEAEALTRTALDLCLQYFTETDELTLNQRFNLAYLLRKGGDTEAAAAEFRELVDLRERFQGETDPSTLDTRLALADTLQMLGRLDEAEAAYRALLAPMREVMSEDHPRTISLLNQLAFCVDAQGRVAEAAELYAEALALARAKLGDSDSLTIWIADSLALRLTALDRLAEAEELHRECLEHLRAQQGPGAGATLRTAFKMVDVMIRRGRHAEALPIAEDYLAAAQEAYPEGSYMVTILRSALGRCLLLGGEADAGERLLEACRAEYEELEDRSYFLTQRALLAVAELLEARGRTDQAAAYHALLGGAAGADAP